MPGPVPARTREAIEAELLEPRDPPRARAEIAREHGVSPRTVSRFAEDLGIANGEPFKTESIRAATQAATDRRRDLRSQLADRLLEHEAPRILERLEAAEWRKTVVVLGPDGGATEKVDEDDAVVARAMKDLHAALKTVVDQTLTIDKTDAADGDQAARNTLDALFGGLSAVYDRVTGRRAGPVDDDTDDVLLDEEQP